MTVGEHLTVEVAKDRHGDLEVVGLDGRLVGECSIGGVRCWTFAPTVSFADVEAQFVEHAARELGICWACSEPVDGWPNREGCDRCWMMWHADQGIWPRDVPARPGAG